MKVHGRVDLAGKNAREGTSHRAVFAVLAVSLGLAFGLALYVYERYVRYVPHVAEHVPDDYSLALRLDVEQAVVYEPFRRHLLPLIEAHRPTNPKQGGQNVVSRLEAIRDRTTIELGIDSRELGVVIDRAGAWIVLLGGHFRQDGVIQGLAQLLRREGIAVQTRTGPERLVHASGATLCVADDGVLILAQTEERALSVLAAGPARTELGPGKALSLTFAESGEGPFSGADLDILPGQTFQSTFSFPRMGAADAEDVVALISGKTGDFKILEGTTGWRVQDAGAGVRRASTTLSRDDFDRTVAHLASGLALLLDLGPPQVAPNYGRSP